MKMDPNRSGQDVLRCHLCETPIPSMYCDICNIQLCKACVGEHVSDDFQKHSVVLFKKRGSTPKCPKHASKICELHCAECNNSICAICVSSGEHEQHKKVDMLEYFENKKGESQIDLEELEEAIFSQYQKIASNILSQKSDLLKNSQKLKATIDKNGEEWHKAIDNLIKNLKIIIDEMDSRHNAVLNKQESDTERRISEIKQVIYEQKKLMESYDVGLVFAYKSKNNEFRELPPKITVSLPTFTPHQINTEKMYEQFGFLTALSIKDDENGCTTPVDDAIPPSARPLIDKAKILTAVTTDYVVHDSFVSVCCLRDDEVWTSSHNNILKLYNLNGKLLKSIKTRPWFIPCGIALTGCSNVVFGDSFNGSLNIVKDTQIWEVIRLQGWTPHGVCSTSSDDLLVIMVTNDRQEKVVRYSGFAEKQSIQFDDKNQPLYSGSRINYFPKCITENRNLDICVADCEAGAVVVVNQAGKLRFRYTGPKSYVLDVFRPFGITSDSQSRILISDYYNHNIHVVDKDGHFLRYINNCELRSPRGLCVDSNDNLIVVEYDTGKIKKINYND
ncbi:uncharacterized protein LOC128173492 [Crassostrea angulata]|uniref:uncharacterized protein LOC128173492 n=1 Tax=Magallana angulata TaxID=2784310 RepID=UPI0022B19F26|nr:uncharacterized protein LOC128173492 [Crassostrea angulata]